MMRSVRSMLMGLMALAAASSAGAQIGVYAMGSGGFLSDVTARSGPTSLTSQSFSAFGGTFGVYDNLKKLGPLRFGADARGFIDSSSNSTPYGNQLRGLLFGGRMEVNTRVIPLRPYLQAELGGVGTNYGTQSSRSSSFAYQFQLGADFTLFPHVDARFEYGNGRINAIYSGYQQTIQEVGAGIVVRLK